MTAKDTNGKAPLGLIPYIAKEQIAFVRQYGCRKYNDKDGDSFFDVSVKDFLDAAERHISKYRDRGHIDEESGLNHLSHAACSLVLAIAVSEMEGEYLPTLSEADKLKEHTSKHVPPEDLDTSREADFHDYIYDNCPGCIKNMEEMVAEALSGEPVELQMDDDGYFYTVDKNGNRDFLVEDDVEEILTNPEDDLTFNDLTPETFCKIMLRDAANGQAISESDMADCIRNIKESSEFTVVS